MTKLKAGTKVFLSERSTWWGDINESSENPMNIEGVILMVRPFSPHCYVVEWSNGTDNLYMEDELKEQA